MEHAVKYMRSGDMSRTHPADITDDFMPLASDWRHQSDSHGHMCERCVEHRCVDDAIIKLHNSTTPHLPSRQRVV